MDGYPAIPVFFVGEEKIGVWRPTHRTRDGRLWLGTVKGFVVKDGSQFRPGPPPDLRSEQYAKDYNEVKGVGAAANSPRAPERTELANFYRSDYLCRTFEQVPRNASCPEASAFGR